MPAGGAWGAFNPYTYQQQRSTGRGFDPGQWGAGKGGNQPPMPYSGFGAWGQPGGQQSQWSISGMSPYGKPSGAGYYSGRTPTGRGGGGGMGGFGPGMGRGPMTNYNPRFQSQMQTSRGRDIWGMGMAAGMDPSSMQYILGLPGYQRSALMGKQGWGGSIPEFFMSQNPMWSGLRETMQRPSGDTGGGYQSDNPWPGGHWGG